MNLKSIVSKILVTCLFFFTANADAKIKYPAPIPTTEFDKMDFAPLYPTFSWATIPKTEFYQVQVWKDEKLFRELKNTEGFDRVTDWQPYLEQGKYFWQVRVVDKKNKPQSEWSEKKFFEVTLPVEVAVLGDSISHGGSNFIPAGQLSCQWQTYCKVPVKNLARSGDTTSLMIERFEREVLPFRPKVLLILGGVNDIREGKTADEVIKNLETLQAKCFENNIKPILATLTPMNPKIIATRKIFLTDKDWQSEQQKVNAWIIRQGGIDISKELCDAEGYLQSKFTFDGLHPDLRGKMLIGAAVEKYLLEE